jgi:hypothetical protein
MVSVSYLILLYRQKVFFFLVFFLSSFYLVRLKVIVFNHFGYQSASERKEMRNI